MSPNLEKVARHEAAHAVAAVRMGALVYFCALRDGDRAHTRVEEVMGAWRGGRVVYDPELIGRRVLGALAPLAAGDSPARCRRDLAMARSLLALVGESDLAPHLARARAWAAEPENAAAIEADRQAALKE